LSNKAFDTTSKSEFVLFLLIKPGINRSKNRTIKMGIDKGKLKYETYFIDNTFENNA
jgi:hypothetical protein